MDDDNLDRSYLATKVCNEISQLRWDDEVEYAETLRDRRKMYTTLLALIVGLGVFKIELYADPKFIQVKPDITIGFVKTFIFFAVICLITSVHYLFKGGTIRKASGYTKTRASEYADISNDEVKALHQGEIHPESALMLKTQLRRLATYELAQANRTVSEHLKMGAFWLGATFLCLVLATMSDTFSPRQAIIDNPNRLKCVDERADDEPERQASESPTSGGNRDEAGRETESDVSNGSQEGSEDQGRTD
ncbi:MAG: hypothetical protein JJ916_10510 [Phycisphaerales bacterium]|nr:hypothetical protein [Phycisphaerales bacterium]